MNILPPIMTVWYHLARKALGERVDIVIFDCSGTLKKEDFPNARVLPFLNLYAATKCNTFLYRIARKRTIGWICDDDMFFLNGKAVDHVEEAFRDPTVASVSFRPRGWWHFEFEERNGKLYLPCHPERSGAAQSAAKLSRRAVSSSYCTAINREIFVEKEHLSLAPAEGNTHPNDAHKPPKRYDTFDLANEQLIRKGYRCIVLPKEVRDECVTGYSAMSAAVMLLWYFKTPEQTLDYLLSPEKKKWRGSVLYSVLGGLLAIGTIQELYERLKGKPYPLPSLPARAALEKVRRDHEPLLGKERSFAWIDETSEKLRNAL